MKDLVSAMMTGKRYEDLSSQARASQGLAESRYQLDVLRTGLEASKLDQKRLADEARINNNKAAEDYHRAQTKTAERKLYILDKIADGQSVSDEEKRFAGALPSSGDDAKYEREAPRVLHENLIKTIMDENGKMVDNPSSERLRQLDTEAKAYGYEVLSIPIPRAEDSGWGLAQNPRNAYMIVKEGETPDSERVLEWLKSGYGYNDDEIEYLRGLSK